MYSVTLFDGLTMDIANGSLDLNQRVSGVVSVKRGRLACCTEIGIFANGALVPCSADALDRCCPTDGAITVDVRVLCHSKASESVQRRYSAIIEHRDEPMSRMFLRGQANTVAAVVPVRTVNALVTDARDTLDERSAPSRKKKGCTYFVTLVAERRVNDASAGRQILFIDCT